MPDANVPQVYVEEGPGPWPTVAEVDSSVPAFVGYTARRPRDATGGVVAVHSVREFEEVFGGPHTHAGQIAVAVEADGTVRLTNAPRPERLLAYAIRHFFANGGRRARIASVGTYAQPLARADLEAGVDAVGASDEPTLVVVPEAVLLDAAGHAAVVRRILAQCAQRRDRFAILDLHDGTMLPDLAAARAAFGTDGLAFGAAYWPFLRTSMPMAVAPSGDNVAVAIAGPRRRRGTLAAIARRDPAAAAAVRAFLAAAPELQVVLPPSAAVAGVYATTDETRGVWKAPANVALRDVVAPAVVVDDAQQEVFQVEPTGGRSLDVIRAFPGRGVLVWGARTLAGNDPEWRYVSVRRFVIVVEQSVRRSTEWAAFEPNVANTWARIRGMVENYLQTKWQQGALPGAKPTQAFFVRCGLGTTMTAQDIAEGRLVLELGLAVARPAEFLILRIAHRVAAG